MVIVFTSRINVAGLLACVDGSSVLRFKSFLIFARKCHVERSVRFTG